MPIITSTEDLKKQLIADFPAKPMEAICEDSFLAYVDDRRAWCQVVVFRVLGTGHRFVEYYPLYSSLPRARRKPERRATG